MISNLFWGLLLFTWYRTTGEFSFSL